VQSSIPATSIEGDKTLSATETKQALPVGTWNVDPVHSQVGFAVEYVVGTFRGSFSGRIAALYANDATIADACFRSSATMWSSKSRSLWWTLVK